MLVHTHTKTFALYDPWASTLPWECLIAETNCRHPTHDHSPMVNDACAEPQCGKDLREGEECYAVTQMDGWVCWRHVRPDDGPISASPASERGQLSRVAANAWRARRGPVMTSLRCWFWKRVLRYRYEICQACGRPVGHHHRLGREPLTWWRAPDDLWNAIEGGGGGLRCPQCFTRDCENAGVPIHWVAVPGV